LIALAASLLPRWAAALDPVIEVKDMPYQLVDRLEGVYTQWTGRWTNGPVYRRTEASFKHNSQVPVFMGPFCGYIFGSGPTTWCITQCEEEHMINSPGLLLPCDQPAPDGTACPQPDPAPAPRPAAADDAAERPTQQPPPPPPPSPPPRPIFCALLGHARKWHEAGNEAGLAPPAPEYWRLNIGYTSANWVDAGNAVLSTAFSIFPRSAGVPPPGERLRLRKDRTVRSAARAELCLGAERGVLAEGVRLLLWDCGHPPFRHERFARAHDATRSGHVLHLVEQPELCASLPTTEAVGAALVLGKCSSKTGALQPAVFVEAEDGTLRVGAAQEICLGTGLDRPELGSELRTSRCAMPAPAPPAAPAPAAAPAAQESTVAVLQAVQAFQQSLEARLESRVESLEREVAALRAVGSGRQEPAVAASGAVLEAAAGGNESSCTAYGCNTLPASMLKPRPSFVNL